MPVIQAENLNNELLNKIYELEKRIERNENKKKFNYNKIKYFIINNKYTIINVLLFILNLYFIYKNIFHNDILNIYEKHTQGVMHLDEYNTFINKQMVQSRIIGTCSYKGLTYFLWQKE